MNAQEARERAAKIHADRAEQPNDDCPVVLIRNATWVDHACGERGLEFIANLA